MVSRDEDASIYELYLSYDPVNDDLANSLTALSKIISNQNKADRIMLSGLTSTEVTSRIVLENIKYDSIHLFVSNLVRETREDEIRDKGLLAYWNQFLIEVRKPFLEYASKHLTLEKKEDLAILRGEAVRAAKASNINSLPIETLSDEQIADCLASYSMPAENMGLNQTYKAICNGEEYTINRNFKVTEDRKAEILGGSEQTLENQTVYIRPKKVIYEGEGMWEFHASNGKTVSGKIMDLDWLEKFQNNRLRQDEYPFPNKILKATADIIIKYDGSNFQKAPVYHIKRVVGPILPSEVPQAEFEGF